MREIKTNRLSLPSRILGIVHRRLENKNRAVRLIPDGKCLHRRRDVESSHFKRQCRQHEVPILCCQRRLGIPAFAKCRRLFLLPARERTRPRWEKACTPFRLAVLFPVYEMPQELFGKHRHHVVRGSRVTALFQTSVGIVCRVHRLCHPLPEHAGLHPAVL